MKRPLSQLVYARIRESNASPRIVTLHDRGLFGRSAGDLGLAASESGRVVALESSKGVYVGRSVVGYTWFVGPDHQPAPLFFGDALAEIERFLWDEVDRQAHPPVELPFLVGVGQGGIMSLAAALAVPDLLSGVVAIDAFLPIVPGWEPPLAPLAGLPILLVDDPDHAPPGNVLSGERLATQLEAWGATMTRVAKGTDDSLATTLGAWTGQQPIRTSAFREGHE